MEEKDAQSKRPEDSAFKQQRLKAWQPLLTPFWVIATFFLIGVLFVILGGVIVKYSNDIVEVEQQYDNNAGCPEGSSGCTLTINIVTTMKAPVYLYYKLTNFYQNHRRYVKSRSDPQLSGDDVSSTSSCDPLEANSGGVPLYPCGLIANSFFNDTFTGMLTSNSINLNMTEDNKLWVKKGISWQSDRDKKFKELNVTGFSNVGPGGFVLPRIDDEDFIVWMRTAGLPTFKKLYRKIEGRDLEAGDKITLTYNNVFPVQTFGGTKSIVLSTTSALGGKNDFLGYAYISVGVVCLVLAIGFLVKHRYSPRTMGDMHYLNYGSNRQSSVPARANQ
jgi:hypothetical protein